MLKNILLVVVGLVWGFNFGLLSYEGLIRFAIKLKAKKLLKEMQK